MPEKTTPKKKISNRNKADFYAKVLDEAEKLDFETAVELDGIDNEITILRVKIKYILENQPQNIRLIMDATNMLGRLIKTRYNITKEQKKGLKEAIGNVLEKYAVPLTAAIISKKL
jgi:hypothetical protein